MVEFKAQNARNSEWVDVDCHTGSIPVGSNYNYKIRATTSVLYASEMHNRILNGVDGSGCVR